MTCSEIENRLPAYMEELLSSEERKTISGHLASCPFCSRAFADLKKAEQLVRDIKEVEPPPFFEQRIMSRVRDEAGRKRGILRRLFYPLHIKVPIQALATLLVAVIAIHVYQAGEPEMKQIAPLSIPLTELGKGRVADAPPRPFVSPPPPTPAERARTGNLPEKTRQRFAAPPPENGRKEEKSTDLRAPMREERPSVVKPADPPMAMQALEVPSVAMDTPDKPQEKAGKEKKGTDLRTSLREERPSVVKPTDPPMAMRAMEIPSVAMDTPDKPRGKAGVRDTDKAFETPPPSQKRKEMTSDAGTAVRESATMTSAPPPPRVAGLAAGEKRSVIDMTIRVGDTDAAIREIEARLAQFSARIVERDLRKGSRYLKAEIAAPHLAVFLIQLEAIGRIHFEPPLQGTPEGYATIGIKIVGQP